MIKYRLTPGPVFKGCRVPNDKEAKQYLYYILRTLHFQYPDRISTVQYRTLKGMVNKDKLVPVFKFLDKRGFDHVKIHYQEYRSLEIVATFSLPIAFEDPVKVYTIDIDTKPTPTS